MFAKMRFPLISENVFFHEIRRDRITSYMDFMTYLIMADKKPEKV